MIKALSKSAAGGGGTAAPSMAPGSAQATTAPEAPAVAESVGEVVTITKADLNKMLADAASRAAQEAVAAMPKQTETVVLKGETKRDQEVETAKINAEYSARVEEKNEELNRGFHRFLVSCKSQPRGSKFVCAGDAATPVPTAKVIAEAKYRDYFGIIATLEVGMAPVADYVGPASDPEPTIG